MVPAQNQSLIRKGSVVVGGGAVRSGYAARALSEHDNAAAVATEGSDVGLNPLKRSPLVEKSRISWQIQVFIREETESAQAIVRRDDNRIGINTQAGGVVHGMTATTLREATAIYEK